MRCVLSFLTKFANSHVNTIFTNASSKVRRRQKQSVVDHYTFSVSDLLAIPHITGQDKPIVTPKKCLIHLVLRAGKDFTVINGKDLVTKGMGQIFVDNDECII